MEKIRIIWNHEEGQADRIARGLIKRSEKRYSWRAIIFPSLIVDYLQYKKNLFQTRKNLLFTKRFAFDAAKEISLGSDRVSEIGSVDAKTKEILDRGRKGFYTEKVRRKQLHEIELLMDHYHLLINSGGLSYGDMIEETYASKKRYLFFLNRLFQAEHDVIKAAITSMRKGSKKDRLRWFQKVEEVTKKTRMEEVDTLFPQER